MSVPSRDVPSTKLHRFVSTTLLGFPVEAEKEGQCELSANTFLACGQQSRGSERPAALDGLAFVRSLIILLG